MILTAQFENESDYDWKFTWKCANIYLPSQNEEENENSKGIYQYDEKYASKLAINGCGSLSIPNNCVTLTQNTLYKFELIATLKYNFFSHCFFCGCFQQFCLHLENLKKIGDFQKKMFF